MHQTVARGFLYYVLAAEPERISKIVWCSLNCVSHMPCTVCAAEINACGQK